VPSHGRGLIGHDGRASGDNWETKEHARPVAPRSKQSASERPCPCWLGQRGDLADAVGLGEGPDDDEGEAGGEGRGVDAPPAATSLAGWSVAAGALSFVQ